MVSEEELALLQERMTEAGVPNMVTFVRKMALNGDVLHVDLGPVRELVSLWHIPPGHRHAPKELRWAAGFPIHAAQKTIGGGEIITLGGGFIPLPNACFRLQDPQKHRVLYIFLLPCFLDGHYEHFLAFYRNHQFSCMEHLVQLPCLEFFLNLAYHHSQ